MKKVFFCSFLFLCVIVSVRAQQIQDSLSLVQQNNIALNLRFSYPDSAITILEKTLAEAKRKNSAYLEGECYLFLSKANWVKANYRLSAGYGFKALRIFENSTYTDYWGHALVTIARDYIDLGELNQAAAMIHSALHLATKNDLESLLVEAYGEQSLLLFKLKHYDSALIVVDKVIEFDEKKGSASDLGIMYSRKAEIYNVKQDYKKGLLYNLKSIDFDRKGTNTRALSIGYFRLAENHYRLNELDTTRRLLETSAKLAKGIGNIPIRIQCYNLLARLYEKQHKTDDALAQFKIVSQLKDSLQIREKSRQLAETMALSELENKEAAIQTLEKENKFEKQLVRSQTLISYFLVTLILLLLSLITVLWVLKKNQSKAHKLLTEKNKAIEQQRKEIQEQAENLHQLNQLKIKLFSLISHDLRGPISNIQTMLNMLTHKMMTHEEFIVISEKLKTDLNINQRTMENLLNWSLSQMDGIRTDHTVFRMSQLVDDVNLLMQEIALNKNITLINNTANDHTVMADYNQVHLILRNIIHNAIKFSPNQKSIFISTQSADSFCQIYIRDQGVGLSASEIETLLKPHNYYSKTGTQHEKGTGLGLLLCKEFVKRNGGVLYITSKLNEGTEVSFTLPMA